MAKDDNARTPHADDAGGAENADEGPRLRVDVLTLFPEMFAGFLDASLLGKARRCRLIAVDVHDIRAFATDKHRTVDDKPFGGGPGMVLMCEPILRAVQALGLPLAGAPPGEPGHGPMPEGTRLVMLTPAGRRLDQGIVEELAGCRRLVLLCGRYEGFDERLRTLLQPDEISIGDYVLTGGEPAAMALVDAVARLVPGVLGHDASAEFESHDPRTGLLDYPVFTRPIEVMGQGVPEVLLSGDHEAIARWRLDAARERTRERRPDMPGAADEPDEQRDARRQLRERIRRMADVSRQQRRGRK